MAAVAHQEKPADEMVKSSKPDPSSKVSNANMSAPKDGAQSDAMSCISSVDATCSIKESELDQEALAAEQAMYYPPSNYYGYYYPGYGNSFGEWDEHGYVLGTDGLELQQPAIQPESGSLVYYMPGFQSGYDLYASFVPGAVIGVDGQYLGQQPYVTSPLLSQPLGSPVYFPPSVASGPEMVPAFSWDSSLWDGSNGNGFVGDFAMPAPKSKFSTKTQTSKPKTSSEETKGSSPVLELPPRVEVPNQTLKPVNKASGPTKGYFPVTNLPPYTYQGKGSLLYPNSPINIKENGRNWIGSDKLKSRNKSNGFGDVDLLNEQNRGPRTNNSKNAWISGTDHAGVTDAAADDNFGTKTVVVRRDDYNPPDFPTQYDQAFFFVIKSYSEDDIHKSIKYNVWASTPNGNKRLDNAYQAAQEKMADKGNKCPIFLFFSVNASGQFCGVAEMIGRVDFNKNMDFWQQDKWSGFFPVKWHIIKDVPNPQFRHIILENNDNKPVTNSRDTQEVKLPQGTEMLNIFKNFSSKTSILDDFSFYENRQKVMQEKRTKVSGAPEHFVPKVDEALQVKKADDMKQIISSMDAMGLGSVKATKDVPPVVTEE